MEFDFLKWIGHASFVLDVDGKTVYIDPFKIPENSRKADAIFITHPHFDHLNMEDIGKIAVNDTQIFVTKDSISKINVGRVVGVEPNRSYSSDIINFSTIPAYNTAADRLDKHPKANGWVGYILDTGNARIYHAGDTDFVPEMEKIKVDLALLPMSGTYTMDPEEAVSAALRIDAKKVAPMHYKAVLGLEKARKAEDVFRKKVSNSLIMKEIQEPFVF